MTVTDQADTTRRELEELAAAVVARLRQTFEEQVTRPLAWRRPAEGLDRLLVEGEEGCSTPCARTWASPGSRAGRPTSPTCSEVRLLPEPGAVDGTRQVRLPLLSLPGSGRIVRAAGRRLIIGPWNYRCSSCWRRSPGRWPPGARRW